MAAKVDYIHLSVPGQPLPYDVSSYTRHYALHLTGEQPSKSLTRNIILRYGRLAGVGFIPLDLVYRFIYKVRMNVDAMLQLCHLT